MKRNEDEEEGWEEPYPNQDGNDRNAWLQVALPACVCVCVCGTIFLLRCDHPAQEGERSFVFITSR